MEKNRIEETEHILKTRRKEKIKKYSMEFEDEVYFQRSYIELTVTRDMIKNSSTTSFTITNKDQFLNTFIDKKDIELLIEMLQKSLEDN